MLNENLKNDKVGFFLNVNEEVAYYLKQIAKSKKITSSDYIELLILQDFKIKKQAMNFFVNLASSDTNSKCQKCGAECPYFNIDKKYKPKNCDYFEELPF